MLHQRRTSPFQNFHKFALIWAVFQSLACGDDSASGDVGSEDVAASDGGNRDVRTDSDAGQSDTGRDDASVEDAPGHDTDVGDVGATCTLEMSDPIEVRESGAVIENLMIRSNGVHAIRVLADDVTIRNVAIQHRGGHGIFAQDANRLVIENVDIAYEGAPESGALESENNNIVLLNSSQARIENARLRHGSTGIYLVGSHNSELRFIAGEDFRGPFPRGQLVQWNQSNDGLLEDFSVVNTTSSWPEDNINVFRSSNIVIRRGLVDGNNSPSGVGVIFDGGASATGRVEDVDAVRMGNGCFSAYAGGDGTVFLRTRCRDNICEDQGRGEPPRSGGLMWAGREGLSNLRIQDSHYATPCNPGAIVWPRPSFSEVELSETDFTPRSAVSLQFCWE